jgi:hypothetical protein
MPPTLWRRGARENRNGSSTGRLWAITISTWTRNDLGLHTYLQKDTMDMNCQAFLAVPVPDLPGVPVAAVHTRTTDGSRRTRDRRSRIAGQHGRRRSK